MSKGFMRSTCQATTYHRLPIVPGRQIGTVGKNMALPPVAGLEFGVADCENSSGRHPNGDIHRRYLSYSDRADRFEIAANPFDPDQNVRSRLMSHPRSQSLDDVNALARALPPAAAAFAVATRD